MVNCHYRSLTLLIELFINADMYQFKNDINYFKTYKLLYDRYEYKNIIHNIVYYSYNSITRNDTLKVLSIGLKHALLHCIKIMQDSYDIENNYESLFCLAHMYKHIDLKKSAELYKNIESIPDLNKA